MPPMADAAAAEDTTVRDWVFTFGSGHRAYAALARRRFEPSEAGQGFPLHNRYVVIGGTLADARRRMVEIFGQVWKLTELVITNA